MVVALKSGIGLRGSLEYRHRWVQCGPMAAFLLAWNPEQFQWHTFQKRIARVQRKGLVMERWSCGNRTYLPKGSEVFLIRLGPALKGLIGRGVTTSEPFEQKHWDPVKRRQKVKALYVKVRFTDLSETPVIPWDELQQRPLSRFRWSIVGSGEALPEPTAEELDRRWEAAKARRTATPLDPSAGVLSTHPFADEWTQELAILGQVDLSMTEKQALIAARHGSGVFRHNVARAEPRCRITGVSDLDHLRATHIKPWLVASNSERLSENNGLMLAPHVDHLFGQGYISFTDAGDLLISPKCSPTVLAAWGIPSSFNVGPFRSAQRPFLAYHRDHCLKS